jgi:hypothetical protein
MVNDRLENIIVDDMTKLDYHSKPVVNKGLYLRNKPNYVSDNYSERTFGLLIDIVSSVVDSVVNGPDGTRGSSDDTDDDRFDGSGMTGGANGGY